MTSWVPACKRPFFLLNDSEASLNLEPQFGSDPAAVAINLADYRAGQPQPPPFGIPNKERRKSIIEIAGRSVKE